MQHKTEKFARKQMIFSRRSLLVSGALAVVYAVVRFAGFALPKKPVYIEINHPPPLSGYLLLADYILFDVGGKTWALPRRCTHLGCKLNFIEIEQILECPCHQSRFSMMGAVIRGPAKKSLQCLVVEKKETAPFYIITAS